MKNNVTYTSLYFLELVDYAKNELVGKSHNIIRHEDMPKVVFRLLWNTVKASQEINAFVKNKAKNCDYYWVKGNITPSFDNNNQIIGFFFVRKKSNKQVLSWFIESKRGFL